MAGTLHEKRELPCQDAFDWAVESGRLIVAVADGAGSAPRAEEGAKLAVKTAVSACSRLLAEAAPSGDDAWEDLLRKVFLETRDALLAPPGGPLGADEAEAPASGIHDLATTLSVAIVAGETLAVGHLGDGAVIAERDGRQQTVSPGRHGEYVNQTFFLTEADALEQTRWFLSVAHDLAAVLVFTDGLQPMAFEGQARIPRAPFFEPLLAFARSDDATDAYLADFLRSDRVCKRSDDDKAIVIAVRR